MNDCDGPCLDPGNSIDQTRSDWKGAYYGSNLRRLVAVKRKDDPGNSLRFAQGVPTRA